MNIDPKNIENLLAEKRYDEVRAIVSAAVAEKMTDKEKGAALAEVASIYLDITNAINAQYISALEEALDSMMAINKAENKVKEKIKLEEVRTQLKS